MFESTVFLYIYIYIYNHHIDFYFSANSRISVIFLVGSDSIFSIEVKKKIEDECKEYSDIILVDDLIEDYNNLTLKTLYTLKFFIEAGL